MSQIHYINISLEEMVSMSRAMVHAKKMESLRTVEEINISPLAAIMKSPPGLTHDV